MHYKHKSPFLEKSRSSEGNMTGIAFWGLKTGKKQRGCCLNARTAKTNRKTSPTLKRMLKLRKFRTDWMLEKILNSVEKLWTLEITHRFLLGVELEVCARNIKISLLKSVCVQLHCTIIVGMTQGESKNAIILWEWKFEWLLKKDKKNVTDTQYGGKQNKPGQK